MLLIGGLAIFFGLSHHHAPALVVEEKQSRKSLPLTPAKDLRYPYSVIPGGVHTSVELKQAVDADLVVKQHYAGFKVSQAHLIKNAGIKKVYVSFRKGKQVFWTKKRVSIPAGEWLMADGEHTIRARCGNRISETAQAETTAEEPSEEEMNESELANDILAFAGQPVAFKAGGNQQTEVISPDTASSESKEASIVASGKESSSPSASSRLGSGSLSGGMPGDLPGGGNVPTGKSGSTNPTAPPSTITSPPLSPTQFPIATLPSLNTFVPTPLPNALLPVFRPRMEQSPASLLPTLYTEKVTVGQISSLPPQNLKVIFPENVIIQSPSEELKPTISVSEALPTSHPEVTTPEVSTIRLVTGALGIWAILAGKRRGWLRFRCSTNIKDGSRRSVLKSRKQQMSGRSAAW